MISRKRKEDATTGTDLGRVVVLEPSTEQPERAVPEAEQGPALLAAAAAEPTLDIYLDRSPKVGQPIDYEAMVKILQRKRQMFITAEQKRRSGEDKEAE